MDVDSPTRLCHERFTPSHTQDSPIASKYEAQGLATSSSRNLRYKQVRMDIDPAHPVSSEERLVVDLFIDFTDI